MILARSESQKLNQPIFFAELGQLGNLPAHRDDADGAAWRGVPPHVADNVPNHIKGAIRGEMELAHKVANALEAAHRSW